MDKRDLEHFQVAPATCPRTGDPTRRDREQIQRDVDYRSSNECRACHQRHPLDRLHGMEEKSGLHDPPQKFSEVAENQDHVLPVTWQRMPIIV